MNERNRIIEWLWLYVEEFRAAGDYRGAEWLEWVARCLAMGCHEEYALGVSHPPVP